LNFILQILFSKTSYQYVFLLLRRHEGSRGPIEADTFIARLGFSRNDEYVFVDDNGKSTAVSSNVPTQASKFQFSAEEKCDIGLWGLAIMGQNFALNMGSHGFSVCVGNRSPSKVDTTVKRAKEEGNLPLVGAKSAEEFIARLSKPRKVVPFGSGRQARRSDHQQAIYIYGTR
jgi:hypothetical protein